MTEGGAITLGWAWRRDQITDKASCLFGSGTQPVKQFSELRFLQDTNIFTEFINWSRNGLHRQYFRVT